MASHIFRRFITYFLFLAFLLPLATVKASNSPDAPDNKKKGGPVSAVAQAELLPTDRIIVQFKTSEASPMQVTDWDEKAKSLSQSAGEPLQYLRAMPDNTHIFSFTQRKPYQQVQTIVQKLATRTDVAYAEPDQMMQHTLTPNDPLYPPQWHYRNETCQPGAYTCGFFGWSHGINLPAAWDINTGSENVVVAVLDTGILPHEDLTGRILPGYDFIDDPWTARDGNGRDPDPSDPGDWVTANECGYMHNAYDSSWHGLHVAGTIAANANNSRGVAGISWGAKILPVRVLGRCGGYTSDIADGMRWAAGLPVAGVPNNPNPAQVLNLSLGGPGSCDSTYQNTINAILANTNAVIVVAAGNSGVNVSNFQPANCNGVITVAATNIDGWQASYSNYGNLIDISAPGGDFNWDDGILSTLNTGKTVPDKDTYEYYQGTSMAAPHISGVISLMLSVHPTLTQTEVLEILKQTARAFPAGSDCTTSSCGAGIVDAAAALNDIISDANINVQIGSDIQTGFYLDSGISQRASYPLINTGPVLVQGVGNALASMRVLYGGVSYSEMMGFPASQVTNAYIFPYYNNVAMNSQLRVSNLGNVDTIISVYLGDSATPIDTFTLVAGQASRSNYPGRNEGPLRVESSNTDILTTIRVLYAGNSYSELMGFPVNQLTAAYLFPWYNNVAMNSQLRVSNLGAVDTTINIYLGDSDTSIDTFTLEPGEASRRNYAGRNDGPMRVVSSDTDIIATIRVLYAGNSYSELMGFPANQLAQEYWYPVYNNVNLNSQLRVSNVGTGPTTITVYFGDNPAPIDTFNLEPGEATRSNYAGRNGGPLRVVSSDQPILSTVRTLYGSSYYEMAGLPGTWAANLYWFPWYNNVAMDSQLRIAVP